MNAKKAFVTTTALVLYAATAFARQEPLPVDANAQFISWYGGRPAAGVKYRPMLRDRSTLLYAQSASSGFSTYAVPDWFVWGSAPSCGGCYSASAADDFIVPGTGKYKITAVYVRGVTLSGGEPSQIHVILYDALKYSRKTGKTTIAIKASCYTTSYSDTGHGDFMVDVSGCRLGRFKSGHDYSVGVQPVFWSNGQWTWRTNRNQINRQAFYRQLDGAGPCNQYLRPLKTCFPDSGYGPDLAFAIYGTWSRPP